MLDTAESLDQSIPRLSGQNDPLLSAVEALIAVTQKRDRGAKVATLLAALRKAKDRDAVPLLISLRRRSVIAAQTADAATIRRRYTELLKRCHPDANGGDRSTEHKLQRVIKAFRTLRKAKLV